MERLNEELAVVGVIDASSSTTTTTSGAIDMKEFDRVMFILSIGAVAGTTDFIVTAGTSTTATDTTVGTITQLSATDDNKLAIVEVDGSVLGERERYVRGKITTSGANAFSVVALGGRARYHPASDNDIAAVAEIVNAS